MIKVTTLLFSTSHTGRTETMSLVIRPVNGGLGDLKITFK